MPVNDRGPYVPDAHQSFCVSCLRIAWDKYATGPCVKGDWVTQKHVPKAPFSGIIGGCNTAKKATLLRSALLSQR